MWTPFLKWCAAQPSLPEHPVAEFSREVVRSVLRDVPPLAAPGAVEDVRFVWETTPGRLLSFQAAAAATGAYAAAKDIMLCLHPQHGAWTAFRAVAVLSPALSAELEGLTAEDLRQGPPAPELAAIDLRPARQAAALAMSRSREGTATWRDWLAARDAVPLGRATRYSEAQLLYHYTKQRDVLERAVAEAATTTPAAT